MRAVDRFSWLAAVNCTLVLAGCAADRSTPEEQLIRADSGLQLSATSDDADGLPEEWSAYLGFDAISQ
ncbi:MAG: hypothetical protein AAGG01_05125, partial [Planctomycetota bacterium]